jgi:hypothetical protein
MFNLASLAAIAEAFLKIGVNFSYIVRVRGKANERRVFVKPMRADKLIRKRSCAREMIV